MKQKKFLLNKQWDTYLFLLESVFITELISLFLHWSKTRVIGGIKIISKLTEYNLIY